MKILGIETSCDETAAAVVEDGRRIWTQVIASSAQMQVKYGGIVPEVAARKQAEVIPFVLGEALKNTGWKEIGAVAVTVGPGLIGSLLVGIETAKTLAYLNHKPIIPVNHLKGHFYAAWLEDNKLINKEGEKPTFPLLGLLVSGGHTELVEIKSHQNLTVLGETRDDAAGEAFDKIARMLGLPYPGGPAIEAEAAKFEKNYLIKQEGVKFTKELPLLPRPMLNSGDYDFSFSGLKTAVYNLVSLERNRKRLKQIGAELITGWLAKETETAICEVLTHKLFQAIEEYKPTGVILAGGVAANKRLRQMTEILTRKAGVRCFIPASGLCTDNAAYIAGAAFFQGNRSAWKNIRVKPNLRIGE